MVYDKEKHKRLNQEHLDNPQPGDYWHECFTPCCVVVRVDPDSGDVFLCKTIQSRPEDKWTWDVKKIERMEKVEFKKFLSYSHSKELGTYADVVPEAHKWILDFVEEL